MMRQEAGETSTFSPTGWDTGASGDAVAHMKHHVRYACDACEACESMQRAPCNMPRAAFVANGLRLGRSGEAASRAAGM